MRLPTFADSQPSRLTLPVAVHLFLMERGRILLLRRFNTGFEDGNYSVPAGHLDGGETILEAAARELLEEVGLNVPLQDLEVAGVMHRRSQSERIDFFVTARSWVGEPENREPGKCDQLAWFPLSALPGNLVPYIRQALDRHLQGKWFHEHGWDR